MEAVRDVWTDERMDDLNHRVDSGFKEVSREFQAPMFVGFAATIATVLTQT